MTDSKNYFTFSSQIDDLLFKGISVSSGEGIFGLCIGVAVFTFLYEAVKAFRHYLVILQMHHRNNSNSNPLDADSGSDVNLSSCLFPFPQKAFEKLKFHCLQTVLHMFQLAMGYTIMLIIMSFNAWFLITIIIVTAMCFYFHEYVLSRKSMILPIEIPGSNL